MIKKRLSQARRLLRREKLDAMLVTHPANRRYLSGFTPNDSQLGESSGALLISQRQAWILTDFRYAITAQEQAPFLAREIYPRGLAPTLAQLCQANGLKKVGFEPEALTVAAHRIITQETPQVEFLPRPSLLSSLRLIKQAGEVAAIDAAGRLMEQALDQVLRQDLLGHSERELALALARRVEDLGAEGVAFDLIIAAGPAGAEPHAEPGQQIIAPGQPVILDVGARLHGYCSDMTRTVVAGGWQQADDTFKKIYPVVRQAQLMALEGIRPGMTGGQADALARQVIEDAGFGPNFGHSLGHGVGLLTHEAPSLSPRSSDLLQPGMVFTVEPGIYLPGWGGVRLEVMVCLEEHGCRVLGELDWFHDFT